MRKLEVHGLLARRYESASRDRKAHVKIFAKKHKKTIVYRSVQRIIGCPMRRNLLHVALDACKCLCGGYIRHVLAIDRYGVDILKEYQ